MLPGFIIGLPVGIEASLIAGILATFPVKAGRRDALRPPWIGVAIAILLCTGLAVALEAVNGHLPQREQERFVAVLCGGVETPVFLVAAGLVSSALHTANEGGWLSSLQGQALDAFAVVAPGSVRASLITGMFGLQLQPTVAEVIGWLAFAVLMAVYVLWPARRPGRGGRSVRSPATGGIPA